MHARPSRSALSPIALAVVAALAAAPAARAQEAATTAGGLEEIIVTAQKREQNLQAVPVAVSVLPGETLRNATSYNIEGLQTLVPSLNFRKGGTNLNSSLFLRGVGTINFSVAAEPSVSTVLDGVVMARAGEAFGDLNDVERIEVLRGPQGTLFGKNASAGVINVVSRMPGTEYGASIDLGIYEDSEYRVKAAADMPFTETFRTRVTAFSGEFDGHIKNLYNGEKINGYDRWGVRGIAVWDPTEDLRLTFIADYREADDNCCGEIMAIPPVGATAAAVTKVLEGVHFRGDETRQVRHNLTTRTIEESYGTSLQVDWDIGDHTLTSITASRSWDNREIREGDWLDQTAPYVGATFGQVHDDGPQESSTFTQELRLASPAGQFLEYVAGLYYFDASADREFTREVIRCASSTLPIDATGQRPCAPAASTYTKGTATAWFGSDITNYAAFGQGTVNFTDAIRGILGLRYTNDEVSYYHDRVQTPASVPGLPSSGTGYRGKTDEDNWSGKVGAQWDINDDLMTYVTYSRGYKGPAFNVFFGMNPNSRPVIDAETVDAYEIGLKATLFDGSTIVNLALFDASYDNYQANVPDNLNGIVVTRLTNAGEVSTSGVELDFFSNPIENLKLSGGLAYTDAQIESFTPPPGVAAGTSDRNGEPLPLAPEWKFSLMADYTWELSAMPFDVFANMAASYTDSQVSELPDSAANVPIVTPLVTIDSYALLDASVGIVDKDNRYRIALVGKNLTDESYASLISTGGPTRVRYLIPREADRYFGLQLRANFGGAR
jgi:iron complex outermembrane receptor protein